MALEYLDQKYIKDVIAVTEILADGQKVIAAIIEYDKKIDNSKLSKSSFSVMGRKVIKVYANNEAAMVLKGSDGRYVIIELSPEDKGSSTIVESKDDCSEFIRKKAKVTIQQIEDIITTEGEKYPVSSDLIESNQEMNLIADDFLNFEFKDLKTGKTLKYNLFLPEGYDRNKVYPMVVFLHDRGVCSCRDNLGLIQGLGGIIWATPDEQAKHQCFVLVPQYTEAIVNDDFEATIELDITVDLINSIVRQYSIDRNKLYGTGQSMGCMSLLEMSIHYPDMFSALLLCAGQWNPETVHVLANNNIWVLVSEGDVRAFNGMNDCMASLEKVGAKISRTKWNGQTSDREIASSVNKVIEEDKNIKYTVFKNGTVVPVEKLEKNDMPEMLLNHMYTWQIVYQIEELRDWLFAQEKTPEL